MRLEEKETTIKYMVNRLLLQRNSVESTSGLSQQWEMAVKTVPHGILCFTPVLREHKLSGISCLSRASWINTHSYSQLVAMGSGDAKY